MRKIVKFILSIILVFTFIGCSQQIAKDRKQELIMWLVGSESQAKAINELAKDFYAKENIRVRCDAISWGDAHSKYLTSIAGDVAPDIGTMGLTWGIEFGAMGTMVDLAAEFPNEIETIREDTFPSIWEATVYKSKIYGIPFDLTEHVLYYRTDIIRNPPKTWGELTDLLVDLRGQGKGMIFDWGSMGWIGFSVFLWQAGGEFYNIEGTKSTLDSPEATQALQFFSDLYRQYGVPKTKILLEQGMRTGDFPIAISGNWKIIELELGAPELAGKWSIAMLPAGPTEKRTAFIGGRVIGVFKKSKYKKEAWEFIKFLSTADSQGKLFDAAQATKDTYLPPNIAAWAELDMKRTFKKVLIDQANDAKGPPAVLGWDSSTRFINEAIQRVVLRKADPAEELKKASKRVTQNIKIR